MITFLALTAAQSLAFYLAIRKGYLFLDFQIQVGKFAWGRRYGIKRRTVLDIVKSPAIAPINLEDKPRY